MPVGFAVRGAWWLRSPDRLGHGWALGSTLLRGLKRKEERAGSVRDERRDDFTGDESAPAADDGTLVGQLRQGSTKRDGIVRRSDRHEQDSNVVKL